MALLPIAAAGGAITLGRIAVNWAIVLVGNLAGSLFVAYFLAVKTGVIGTAGSAGSRPRLTYTRLAAIWPRARPSPRATCRSSCARSAATGWSASASGWPWPPKDIGGKILAIFFPITAFVAWASTTSWPTCSSCRRDLRPRARRHLRPRRQQHGLRLARQHRRRRASSSAGGYWFLYLRKDRRHRRTGTSGQQTDRN